MNTKGHSNKQNVGRTHSDICWSRSIGEIDAQLYEHSGLEEDEVEFLGREDNPER